MQKWFRQIINIKSERRNRFYYEFWRFDIKNDYYCYMKCEDSFYFFVCSDRVRKIFRKSSNSFFLTMLISSMRKFIFLEINTFKNAFLISKSSFDNFDEWEQRKLFFRKKKLFSLFNDLSFRKKNNYFFVLHRNISSRYFDCHKNVNHLRWFRFKRWCIIKRKQLKFFWWWDFFFYHRFRDNIFFQNYSERIFVLKFCCIAFYRCFQIFAWKSHDTLHNFFFFFFKKIHFLVRIEKLRFIRNNVAIIIYVVFLWIWNSKDIDKVIFYQMFNKSSRFHFFISFECIYFFKKWQRFTIKHF